MAVAPPYNIYDGDGSTSSFQYGFENAGAFGSILVKWLDSGAEDFVQWIEGVEYEHFPSTKTIVVNTGYIPATGDTLRIERFTTRERLVDYISGSSITEPNLDNDANRLTQVTQEIEADIANALLKNDALTRWNAEDLSAESCGPSIGPDSWVTRAELDAAIVNGQVSEYATGPVFRWIGDGSTTEYELTGERGLDPTQVFVFIDGVPQSPYTADPDYTIIAAEESAYPSIGDVYDFLSLEAAPPLNAKIEVRVLKGVVIARAPTGFIDDPSIIGDDVIGIQHMNFGVGDPLRFLVIDAQGDPTDRVAVHTDISDFDAGVRANRLDQMAAPTAPVGMGGQRIISMGAGASPNNAVTLSQLESYIAANGQFFHTTILQADLPALGVDKTINVGFNANVVLMSFTNSPVLVALYAFTFPSSLNQMTIHGPRTGSGGTPLIRFTRSGTQLTIRVTNAGNGYSPTSDAGLFCGKV